jgi:hypothetical protein
MMQTGSIDMIIVGGCFMIGWLAVVVDMIGSGWLW